MTESLALTAERIDASRTYAPASEVTDADREAMRRHPLATRTGLALLTELLTADQAWRACTKPQRRLLAAACLPAVTVLADSVSLPAEALPWLPDDVRPAMRDALVRRGMAREDGQITAKAVHACYWVWWRDARREPAEVTA